MKKQLFVGASVALAILALSSCNNKGADYTVLRKDNIKNTALATEIGLVDPATDVKLDTSDKEGTNIYDIYVKTDAVSSLFVYKSDLTDFFASENGSRSQYATISALTFANPKVNDSDVSTLIYDEETTAIMENAFQEENGIKAKLQSTGLEVFTTAEYTRKISLTDAYKEYAKNPGKVEMVVVYLPTHVIHLVKNNSSMEKTLSTNVMIPVYATFVNASGKEITADGVVESKVSTIRTIELADALTGTEYFGQLKNE